MKKWITGKKILEDYNLPAAVLGEACHKGELTAYQAETNKPIYDIATVARVPKYPPAGVDPQKYVKSGETVRWNWEKILGVNKLRATLQIVKNKLSVVAVALKDKGDMSYLTDPDLRGLTNIPLYLLDKPSTIIQDGHIRVQFGNSPHSFFSSDFKHYRSLSLDKLTQAKKEFAHQIFTLECNIRQITEVPFQVKTAEEIIQFFAFAYDELQSVKEDQIWKTFMPVAYNCKIGEEIVELKNLEGQLFYFDFDMYRRRIKTLDERTDNNQIISAYKQQLAEMWFDLVEVEEVFGARTVPETAPNCQATPDRPATEQENATVTSPLECKKQITKGKDYKETIKNTLEDNPEVVALVELLKKQGRKDSEIIDHLESNSIRASIAQCVLFGKNCKSLAAAKTAYYAAKKKN